MKIMHVNGYSEEEIYELIKLVKNNDNFALQELISIFDSKLKSSAKEINSSDAYEILLSKFMECIIKMPLESTFLNHTLINYIYSSIKKSKIKEISKTYNKVNLTNETYIYDLTDENSTIDEFDDNFSYIIDELSQHEKDILKLYYKYDFTEKEIGEKFNITKQAVSKRKKKSLKKLKNLLS